MASSDFSSTYMLGVRLVAFPSRPGTRVRVWMRPPRFRAKRANKAASAAAEPVARSLKRYLHVPGECATPNSNHFPDGTSSDYETHIRIVPICGTLLPVLRPQLPPPELGPFLCHSQVQSRPLK